MKSLASLLALSMLLIRCGTCAFTTSSVQVSETVYIKADGSIDPVTAPIFNLDNSSYMLLNDIYGSIVVQRNKITIDGNGHILSGIGTFASKGISIIGNESITVRNFQIRNFSYGIFLSGAKNISILRNKLSGNLGSGIYVWVSQNSLIEENEATNNFRGMWLDHSYNSTLRGNRLADNFYNLDFSGARLSHFLHDIDATNTVNNRTICYWANKRNLTVPVDAGYVALANCTQITAQNLNLSSNMQGILLAYTENSTITYNRVLSNRYGIQLYNSSYNHINANMVSSNEHGIRLYNSSSNIITCNNVSANKYNAIWLDTNCYCNTIHQNQLSSNERGILAGYSRHNNITANDIARNGKHGIWLWQSSNDYFIAENNITENQYLGIELQYSSSSTITRNNITANAFYGINLYDSFNNIIIENTISDNWFNIQFSGSSNSLIYHNNFVNNTPRMTDEASTNVWDSGWPSGGNYWSTHQAKDDDHDGLTDEPYMMNTRNIDNYPLAGSFSSISISPTKQIHIVSNSTITSCKYMNGSIRIETSEKATNQTYGFCRLTIPHSLLTPPYIVKINDNQAAYQTITENSTFSTIWFDYEDYAVSVEVVPELHIDIILLLLATLSLLILVSTNRSIKLQS